MLWIIMAGSVGVVLMDEGILLVDPVIELLPVLEELVEEQLVVQLL